MCKWNVEVLNESYSEKEAGCLKRSSDKRKTVPVIWKRRKM